MHTGIKFVKTSPGLATKLLACALAHSAYVCWEQGNALRIRHAKQFSNYYLTGSPRGTQRQRERERETFMEAKFQLH